MTCCAGITRILKSRRTCFLLVVLCGVIPVLIIVSILSWRWTTVRQLHRLSLILKLDMLAGLLALYLGRPLA